ncbi:MAG TPA: hypothetical protein VHS29_12485, partial [Candidatus Acidoferrales bacterium]|nr:hypothetical protein [Candidatus Acidoferrales bacterium]
AQHHFFKDALHGRLNGWKSNGYVCHMGSPFAAETFSRNETWPVIMFRHLIMFPLKESIYI